MTELLYLPDDDGVTAFSATVTEATPEYIVLDGTYFYPEGGGQPADHGVIEWEGGRAEIDDVRKNHGDVRHCIEALDGELPAEGATVEAEIDAERREKLTRMHTAQHVLSRVVLDEYGAETAGNQVYEDRSRIDFEPANFDDEDVAFIEERTNEVIDRALSVEKENRPRQQVEANVKEGRALLNLIPDSVDPLRVVEIEDFDMCPCGGTHVESLEEIGRVEVIDDTSKGADTHRIEFELRD
jgi:misacylated tRNA(Ala) deacylase